MQNIFSTVLMHDPARRTRQTLFALFVFGLLTAIWQTYHFILSHTFYSWNQLMNTRPSLALISWVSVGIILQLTGHAIRAYKQQILLAPITRTSTQFLFQALTIGFLFNALLPLRIGELIRAHVIGKTVKMSRTVVFLTIIIERLIDAVLLLSLFLLLSQLAGRIELSAAFLPLFIATMSGLFIILLLYREPQWLLKVVYSVTALFNKRIKDQGRFIAWSALYGVKTIVNESKISKYITASIVMWVFYVSSLYALYQALFPLTNHFQKALGSVGSYINASLPSGPAFIGTYHSYTNAFLASLQMQPVEMILFAAMLSWAVLILPTALIAGVILFFSKRDQFTLFLQTTEPDDTQHKLLRFSDITNELSDFLEIYFRAATLGKILSSHEMTGKIRLLRTLTGGSKATTVLVEKNGQKIIRKTALPEDGDKLIDQYNWLNARAHLPEIPNVLTIDKDTESVSIEIAYESGYLGLYEYIHSHTHEQNTEVILRILQFMQKHIYVDGTHQQNREIVFEYIQKKMIDKLQETAAINIQVQELLRHETVIINGKEYINLPQMIDIISRDNKIIADLSTFYETAIHGDLTIDNIIINDGGDFLLLDPNNENAISDPVVDYAKLYQSLHSGYEFLRTTEHSRVTGNVIEFTEEISSKYHQLFSVVDSELQKIVSPEQYRTLLFHEAVHYCRMLPYRVPLNPKTVGAFYAIATRLLNEYNDYYAKKT